MDSVFDVLNYLFAFFHTLHLQRAFYSVYDPCLFYEIFVSSIRYLYFQMNLFVVEIQKYNMRERFVIFLFLRLKVVFNRQPRALDLHVVKDILHVKRQDVVLSINGFVIMKEIVLMAAMSMDVVSYIITLLY